MILVKTFYAYNDLRNFSYLITDDQTGDAWVIDPYDADPMIKAIKKDGLKLKGILNTHQHFDHIRGNEALLGAFDTKISKLKGSETISINENHEIHFLDTPGHTMDHQVFIWKEKGEPKALFSGDTLFNSGVGNCKGGGDVDALFETTEMLKKSLPSSISLYPGHDYVIKNLEFALSCEPDNLEAKERLKEMQKEPIEKRRVFKLGEELEVNPFFRLEKLEAYNPHLQGRSLFKKLRSLRDNW